MVASGGFDAENEYYLLDNLPFADHGALLDPPTSDVTARCVGFLSQVNQDENIVAIKRGIDFLKSEQEEDGSWFGRWGTNYIWYMVRAVCSQRCERGHGATLYPKSGGLVKKLVKGTTGGGAKTAPHTGNIEKRGQRFHALADGLGTIRSHGSRGNSEYRSCSWHSISPDQFEILDGWEDKLFNAVGFSGFFTSSITDTATTFR